LGGAGLGDFSLGGGLGLASLGGGEGDRELLFSLFLAGDRSADFSDSELEPLVFSLGGGEGDLLLAATLALRDRLRDLSDVLLFDRLGDDSFFTGDAERSEPEPDLAAASSFFSESL